MRLASTLAIVTLLLPAAAKPAPPPGASLPQAAAPAAQAAPDLLHADLETARSVYSGERAREAVAFVEQFWRVPGNRGFDASIARVVEVLERAGYVNEDGSAGGARLTYRIEHRPMDGPTWDPVDAELGIVGGDTLLKYGSNRNMLAINSYATPLGGVEAEVVYAGDGSPARLDELDVAGKIVFADTSVSRLFRAAVIERGAVGVLSYSMPSYTQPERNRDSIQFSSIPLDPERRAWGLRLSYAAREKLLAALEEGAVRLRVRIDTDIYDADELTLVAEVHGATHPDERFVFSAHVQEPGANDNASGVGALAEAARALADLVQQGSFVPRRTITMLWGDEISSTRRYLEDDPARAEKVLWGMSLDMVGEDTAKTGGTFLIEKMPDPSAVWTRGDDHHTEWGGRPLSVDALTPHYFNDFVLARCHDQAADTGWVVRTNPYEGGSDHVPFLRAGRPGLLLWHFTDQFYHTDGDRLEMVSADTLRNVGVCALTSAMVLTTADGATARAVIAEVEAAALRRLQTEYELSRAAVASGDDRDEQALILSTWTSWYVDAVGTTSDIEVGGSSEETLATIAAAQATVSAAGEQYLQRLRAGGGPR
ncbi:MAG: M28 family peptidase [Acidobacteriota bacterium]